MTGNASQRRAFGDGAHARRGGLGINRGDQFYTPLERDEREQWVRGWRAQSLCSALGYPKTVSADDFHLSFDTEQVLRWKTNKANRKELAMTTRSADELETLRNDYRTNTYDPYVAGLSEGQTAQPFEEAFAAHLAAIDAQTGAAPKKSGGKGGGKKAAAKKGGAKKAAAPKKAKEPKAPRAKAFRPSSDDRKTFNAAAAKVAGKDVKAPRLLPAGGQTYTDFLQGKVLKLDADGNGSTVLNVVSAKDTKTVLGTVTVEVTANKVKATGAKA